jgi:hypothetical protein
MKVLSKENAKKIIDWYDLEGMHNWGGWGRYPDISIRASYNSFEDCHCRITFAEIITLEDESENFDTIADSRINPGENRGYILISELREYILTDNERMEALKTGWRNEWNRAKTLQTTQAAYEAQPADVKRKIESLQNNIRAIFGQPGSRKLRKETELLLSQYILPIEYLHSDWIIQALNYDTVEDYLNFKLENFKK